MPNENSVNPDEISIKRKVHLVGTDSEGDVAEDTHVEVGDQTRCLPPPSSPHSPPSPALHHAPAPANAVDQTDSILPGHCDPTRIMNNLPADEFFKVLEQSTPEQLQTIIRSFEKDERTRSGAKWLQRIMHVPKGPRSILAALLWWECRRPLYNLAVGLAGLPSILILKYLFGMGHTAIFAALFYAFFANVCYCLGTPAELVARLCWKEKAENYGPVLLTLGTIFSVILTVFLELLVCAYYILGALSARF